jgi:hypothetical protein
VVTIVIDLKNRGQDVAEVLMGIRLKRGQKVQFVNKIAYRLSMPWLAALSRRAA